MTKFDNLKFKFNIPFTISEAKGLTFNMPCTTVVHTHSHFYSHTNISIIMVYDYSYELRAFTSIRANFLSILHEKTYSFYFTLSLLQNTHISSSILQDISIKYSLFSIFLLFLSTTSLYTRSLSLSTHFSTLLLSLYTHLSGHCSTKSPLAFLFQITKPIHLPLPPPSQNLSHHQISTTHSP